MVVVCRSGHRPDQLSPVQMGHLDPGQCGAVAVGSVCAV
jgi:hypothetical protein